MGSIQIYFAMGYAIWTVVLVTVLPIGSYFYSQGTLEATTFILIMILSLGIIGPLLAAIGYTYDIAKIDAVVNDICKVLDAEELVRPTKEVGIKNLDISGGEKQRISIAIAV